MILYNIYNMDVEPTTHFNTEQLIANARLISNAASKEKDELLKIVNDTHRRKDELQRAVEEGQTPFFQALRSTRSQLKVIAEKDNKQAISALEIFKRFASPIYRDQTHLYAFFTTEADMANGLLEDPKSYKDFGQTLPFGLKTVMESVSEYNREHSLLRALESPKTRIKRELNQAVSFAIQFSKKDWPFAVSWKNLKEIGPVVATTTLENSQALREATAKRFPESEAEMEKIITTSRLILDEYPFGEISDFRVKVLGQLALGTETDQQRANVVNEALDFERVMQNSRNINKLLTANEGYSLEDLDQTTLINLYKGWFAYRSLQVSHEEPIQVWGSKIKGFDWKNIIKDRTDLYHLKENNMWIL